MTLRVTIVTAACAIAMIGPMAVQAQGQAASPGPRTSTHPAAGSARADLLVRASTELAAGRRSAAAQLLTEAADRFGSAEALLQLARLQASGNDMSDALASLARARAAAPNSEEVLGAYAQLSLATHAVDQAVDVLRSLTRIAPAVAEYHYLLGVGLMQAGDAASAIESLQAADRIEPNKGLTLVALGLACNDRKLYADAKGYLLRGIQLEPDSLEALAALAEAEDGLGELDAAQRDAGRVLAARPDHPAANFVLGLVSMKREQYADARDAFLRALDAAPDLAKAHYQLSLAYARLGDTANAERHVALYRKSTEAAARRSGAMRGESGDGGTRR